MVHLGFLPQQDFKVIENDSISLQSMSSLGRVGRILAGSIDPSGISIDREFLASSTIAESGQQPPSFQQLQQQQQLQQYQQQLNNSNVGSGGITETSTLKHAGTQSNANDVDVNRIPSSLEISFKQPQLGSNTTQVPALSTENKVVLQEPDVIASTKLAHSKTTDSITSSGPIAPPRRKKKCRKFSSSSPEQFNLNEGMPLPAVDTDTNSDARSVNSVLDVQQKLREDLVKDIENSWAETASLTNKRNEIVFCTGGFFNSTILGVSGFNANASSNTALNASNSLMALRRQQHLIVKH
ncbi:uncharacterized protein LOC119638783 [Glossina fuscipes]|uniref:Uncharacterized protein LOC119638783 n=1 Tax=Glossina fuscipes TaxID=7396 RepID=A0A9C5Z267_9MUSC|nr:uncharacterized protein LOC119638783 [Glossina fuscipes]